MSADFPEPGEPVITSRCDVPETAGARSQRTMRASSSCRPMKYDPDSPRVTPRADGSKCDASSSSAINAETWRAPKFGLGMSSAAPGPHTLRSATCGALRFLSS